MSLQSFAERPMKSRACLIIGGGVMGLSTAWHLLKDGHHNVTVLDHPDPLAPSRDISKFCRVDYMDPKRMKIAIECKRLWEEDDFFKQFFHRTGRIVAYPPDQVFTLTGIDRARSQLKLPDRKHESAELLERVFKSATVSQQLEMVQNEDDGVIDWNRVMKDMKQECIKMGGKFQETRVLYLHWEERRTIDIVVTSDCALITFRMDVILAAGPWIMQLLDAWQIRQPPIPRAPIATGIFAFHLDMDPQQWAKYRGLPPLCEIGLFEFVCHPRDVGIGKVTASKAFRYPSRVRGLSEPHDVAKSDLAVKTMLEAQDWVRTRLPGLKGARIKSIRSYWDGVTGNQKPIIARHPDHTNLVIAGGGSYTHAKDLPYIGRVITDVVQGTEIHSQFGWDQSHDEKHLDNGPALYTDLLFDDLELEASRDQRVKDWKKSPDWAI